MQPWVHVEQIMGLPISLHVRGVGEHQGCVEKRATAFFEHLKRADHIFSLWRPDSDISRLARGEVGVAQLDPLVNKVWELAEHAQQATGGAYSAFGLSDDYRPIINGKHVSAHFDPTGLVKGWAVEEAATAELEHLVELGMSVCVNAGGDVWMRTAENDPEGWNVGIENAANPQEIATVIKVRNGAVATSGTYARGQHIYSPLLDMPAPWEGSLTVSGPTLTWADIWATAAFASPEVTPDHGCTVVIDQRKAY